MTNPLATDQYQYHFDRPTQGPAGLPFHAEDLLDERLVPTHKLPAELGSAPVASWVLARLRDLAPESIPETQEDFVDGGAYCVEMAAMQGETTIAELQIQGDSFGVVLIGYARSEEEAAKIFEDFTKCLLTAPQNIAVCRWEIYDPEWEDDPSCYTPEPTSESRNEFGWDGTTFLGRFNIREV